MTSNPPDVDIQEWLNRRVPCYVRFITTKSHYHQPTRQAIFTDDAPEISVYHVERPEDISFVVSGLTRRRKNDDADWPNRVRGIFTGVLVFNGRTSTDQGFDFLANPVTRFALTPTNFITT